MWSLLGPSRVSGCCGPGGTGGVAAVAWCCCWIAIPAAACITTAVFTSVAAAMCLAALAASLTAAPAAPLSAAMACPALAACSWGPLPA